MSDIYDYPYMHVMRHPVEVNSYTTAPMENSTVNEVNSSDFTPRDLQLFVDSLETITRLEQGRQSQRYQNRNCSYKMAMESSNRMITCLDDSIMDGGCNTTVDDDAKSLYTSSEFDNIYDETYYDIMPNIAQSSTRYSSNITTDSLKLSNSGSEESGVFLNQTSSDDHEYENIDAIRPRSKVVSHQKSKSLKSRLIALIMKKQYIQPELPSVEFLSSTTIGEDTEGSEIYERILDDVIQQQFGKNPKNAEKNQKKKKNYFAIKKRNASAVANAEEKFLDKAMRLLTL